MNRVLNYMTIVFTIIGLLIPTAVLSKETTSISQPVTVSSIPDESEYTYNKIVKLKRIIKADKQIDHVNMSEKDIDLIAIVTMAEAEGECEDGQRLVIDTILNRVDSEHFPDTVSEVIYQPNQFTSMWNGRVERCYIKEDIRQLVLEELKSRTNNEVLFFHADHYGKYGQPMFSVGNHYFSSYD